jgi:hypothetical protein
MALPVIAAATALAAFFPSIVRWLKDGDNEKVASDVLKIAQYVTGEDELLDIQKKLTHNPMAVIDFQRALIDLEKGLKCEEVQDRHSARKRDISLIKSGRKNWRADIMVIAAALGLAACLFSLALYRYSLPGEAVGIISTIAGIFGSCLKDAYTFEFGSSRGSREKDLQVSSFIKRLP